MKKIILFTALLIFFKCSKPDKSLQSLKGYEGEIIIDKFYSDAIFGGHFIVFAGEYPVRKKVYRIVYDNIEVGDTIK